MGSARMGTIAMKIRIAGLAAALLLAFAAHAQTPATTPPAGSSPTHWRKRTRGSP